MILESSNAVLYQIKFAFNSFHATYSEVYCDGIVIMTYLDHKFSVTMEEFKLQICCIQSSYQLGIQAVP